ncbi:MAG TPA: hypothetical protein VG346_12040 [Acidimicrobiales bacterium]|nr:hypothetical protein [Acidimicrobiales bacterium]
MVDYVRSFGAKGRSRPWAHHGVDPIDQVADQRLDAKVLDMARKLNDVQLATLAFPSADNVITDIDLLMDPGQRGDPQTLFAHLQAAR